MKSMFLLFVLCYWNAVIIVSDASPISKPYIPFWTSPYDQGGDAVDSTTTSILHHTIDFSDANLMDMDKNSRYNNYEAKRSDVRYLQTKKGQCPITVQIGISKKNINLNIGKSKYRY